MRVETRTGRRPVVVGMDTDRINSWLAFYRGRGQDGPNTGLAAYETAGRHLFDRESHMDRYWFPASELEGTTAVLVGANPADLDGHAIDGRIRRGSSVRSLTAYRGETAGAACLLPNRTGLPTRSRQRLRRQPLGLPRSPVRPPSGIF